MDRPDVWRVNGIQPCNHAIGSWNDPSENTHKLSLVYVVHGDMAVWKFCFNCMILKLALATGPVRTHAHSSV